MIKLIAYGRQVQTQVYKVVFIFFTVEYFCHSQILKSLISMLFSSKGSFWFSQFECTKEIKFLMHWFYICVTTLGLPLFNPHLALYTNCVLLMVNCLLISTSIWLIAHLSLWFHISLPIITVLICNSYHFLSVLVYICIFKFACFLVFIYEVTQEY